MSLLTYLGKRAGELALMYKLFKGNTYYTGVSFVDKVLHLGRTPKDFFENFDYIHNHIKEAVPNLSKNLTELVLQARNDLARKYINKELTDEQWVEGHAEVVKALNGLLDKYNPRWLKRTSQVTGGVTVYDGLDDDGQ